MSSPEKIKLALKHLRKADPVMQGLIEQVGPYQLKPDRSDRFAILVQAIISQQISTAAARSIRLKLDGLLAPQKVTPPSILRFGKDQLRTVGLSNQKSSYLLDLCQKVDGGHVDLKALGRRSDERVIDELTQVKGIGRWTAQMFLIFSLGRLDVFPHDDLGIRMAIRNLYKLDDLPDKQTSHRIAEPWRPYASVASWYCWRSFDLAKKAAANGGKVPV